MSGSTIERRFLLLIDEAPIRSKVSLILRDAGEAFLRVESPDGVLSAETQQPSRALLVGGTGRPADYRDRYRDLAAVLPDLPLVAICEEEDMEKTGADSEIFAETILSPCNHEVLLGKLRGLRRNPSKAAGIPTKQSRPTMPSGGEFPYDPVYFRIPGSSDAAVALREEVIKARAFRRVCLVTGEEGTRFESVVRSLQLEKNHRPLYPLVLAKAEITRNRLPEVIDPLCLIEDSHPPIVYIDEVEEMTGPERNDLLDFFEKHFARRRHLRFVLASVSNSFHSDPESQSFLDRLASFTDARITIPPLRQRRADVPLLAQKILYELTAVHTFLRVRQIEPEAEDYLARLPLSGNDEELISTIRTAAASCNNRTLTLHYLHSLQLEDMSSAQILETSADQVLFEH